MMVGEQEGRGPRYRAGFAAQGLRKRGLSIRYAVRHLWLTTNDNRERGEWLKAGIAMPAARRPPAPIPFGP